MINKEHFNIGLYSDAYEPIYFKLGMMIDTTKLYRLPSLDLNSKSQAYKKAISCAVTDLKYHNVICHAGRSCKGDDCREIL